MVGRFHESNCFLLCVAAVLLLVLLLPTVTNAEHTAKAKDEKDKLVFTHSLVSLLNQVPGVWSASVTLPHTATAGERIELGELRLERQSASAVTVHLPPLPAAGTGPLRRLAFTAISCEEFKHAKGKCFFYVADDEAGAVAVDGEDEEADEDGELFLDYVVQQRRSGGVSDAVESDEMGVAGANGEIDPSAEDTEAQLLASHRRRRRNGKNAKAGAARKTGVPPSAGKTGFVSTTTRLLRLRTVEDGVAQDQRHGGSGESVKPVGAVTLAKESLTRNGVDVEDAASTSSSETREYTVVLQFHLDDGSVSDRRPFPLAVELRGLTGDVQQRLALRLRQEKLRKASSFFCQWLYPLCYLAGLYGVLWAVKAIMDRRAKQQQQQQPKAKEAAVRPKDVK